MEKEASDAITSEARFEKKSKAGAEKQKERALLETCFEQKKRENL